MDLYIDHLYVVRPILKYSSGRPPRGRGPFLPIYSTRTSVVDIKSQQARFCQLGIVGLWRTNWFHMSSSGRFIFRNIRAMGDIVYVWRSMNVVIIRFQAVATISKINAAT